MSQLEIGK